jgi:hypothetical protein
MLMAGCRKVLGIGSINMLRHDLFGKPVQTEQAAVRYNVGENELLRLGVA